MFFLLSYITKDLVQFRFWCSSVNEHYNDTWAKMLQVMGFCFSSLERLFHHDWTSLSGHLLFIWPDCTLLPLYFTPFLLAVLFKMFHFPTLTYFLPLFFHTFLTSYDFFCVTEEVNFYILNILWSFQFKWLFVSGWFANFSCL